MNYYTDFAAKSGFEYMLVDAGWSARDGNILASNPQVDMPEIVRHASSAKVKVWLWLHWTTADRQMSDAFPLYEKWGIAGVKIDFMDSNDQRMVDFMHRAAKLAAEHHLMVDFHGANPPWGLRRTYPNVMAHEGVLGLEFNKWSSLPDPDHNTMIPFTRGLAGPMDYTPGRFRAGDQGGVCVPAEGPGGDGHARPPTRVVRCAGEPVPECGGQARRL